MLILTIQNIETEHKSKHEEYITRTIENEEIVSSDATKDIGMETLPPPTHWNNMIHTCG